MASDILWVMVWCKFFDFQIKVWNWCFGFFFSSATVLATFQKNWAIFHKSSGHPAEIGSDISLLQRPQIS